MKQENLTVGNSFGCQVKNVVSEAKRERNVLSKEVTKISNFGISV